VAETIDDVGIDVETDMVCPILPYSKEQVSSEVNSRRCMTRVGLRELTNMYSSAIPKVYLSRWGVSRAVRRVPEFPKNQHEYAAEFTAESFLAMPALQS
jgi:hypothetical protein